MNTDVEDLLREGMERFTSDLRAPAGLTRRAARQRRLRLVRRSVAGVTAALAAAAVALVVPGAGHHGIGGRAVPADYVVKRISSALGAAEPGSIAQMTVTTRFAISGGRTKTSTAEEWSDGDRWRSVTLSGSGRPVYDEGSTASSVFTLVSYLNRSWGRRHLPAGNVLIGPRSGPRVRLVRPGYVPRRCVPRAQWLFRSGLAGLGPSTSSLPATVARDLRTAISCGTLAVVGRQHVDGIEAIKLASRPKSPINETIWVSPGTYLPLRVVVRDTPTQPVPAGGAEILRQTADITWLSPTASNLARLTVPIPAGFRRVPLIRALWPVLQALPLASSQGYPSQSGPRNTR
jgi:hypothetical protein